jgi:LacI family transcriptional regulator
VANIYSVAKQARVSVATVSAVVNQTAYVSPQLRARVEAAIRKLGYQPNLMARSLAVRKSHMLGMIVPDIANPFWPEVVRGAEDKAHELGYTLLLSNSDDSPAKEELYLRLFLAKRVDGIILAKAPGVLKPDLAAGLKAAQIATTLVMRVQKGVVADAVLVDDKDGAYEGVTHLARLGYRRIGIIAGAKGFSTSRRRLEGYRQALKDSGQPFDPTLVCVGNFRVDSGYAAGLDLLKKKPSAVFISNYLMAVGFMKAMRQYQLRCPQDVAIVTCDDHPWLDSFTPRLTTVNFPKYDVGAEAARLLVERLKHRDRPIETVQLKSSLQIRDSCGYSLKAVAV